MGLSRNFELGPHLRLRGGAPAKGGKGAKGGAKDTATKAAGGGKEAPVEARTDVAFPEERLEDQPEESGARHEFWVWSQNLKKEYEDGTREVSEELLEKKSRSSKTLSVGAHLKCLVHTNWHTRDIWHMHSLFIFLTTKRIQLIAPTVCTRLLWALISCACTTQKGKAPAVFLEKFRIANKSMNPYAMANENK